MAWLLRDGEVIASVEFATDRHARRRGLLGRDGIDGVLCIEGVRSVHTVGMRFPIDVVHLAADGTVLRVTTMARHRVGRPVRRTARVLEAEAGLFGKRGVSVGQQLEIRTTDRETT